MSLLDKLGNPDGFLLGGPPIAQFLRNPGGFAFNKTNENTERLLRSLVPKPDLGGAPDPVYSADLSNDYPRPGDPVAYLFGSPSFFPRLRSSWVEYVDNRQITHAVLDICYGPAQLLEVTNNRTPFTASAGLKLQLALPGERTTLSETCFVYVNPDLQGLELPGGALDLRTTESTVSFAVDGNITATDNSGPFETLGGGDRFTVTGTTSNNVEFLIDSVIDDNHVVAHRADSAPIVAETSACVINVYSVVIGGAGGWAHAPGDTQDEEDDPEPAVIPLVFAPGDGSKGTVKLPGADWWADIAVGDLIQSTLGANRSIEFELLAINEDTGVISPEPVAESVDSALVRLRRRLGPYQLCAPGQMIDGFNLNMACLAGLYRTNKKGKLRTQKVQFEPQVQRIDDVGNALAPITSLGEREMAGRDRTPQRETFSFRGLPAARYQLYIARTSPANDDSGTSDSLTVESMVGFCVPGDVDPDESDTITRLAMTVTANAPLQQGLRVRVRARGMHALWDGTAWTAPQPTEDIAPAYAALLRNQGREIDVAEYAAAHSDWQSRGWEYHGYLTGSTTLDAAVQDVLRAGDARPWFDWTSGLRTLWRDRAPESPVLMLHDGNTDAASMDDLDFGAVPEDAPTGFFAKYTDVSTGESREVPVGDVVTRPQDLALSGVQSRQQAFELGSRELARQAYRRQALEGRVLWTQRRVDFGAPALVQSVQHRLGQIQIARDLDGLVLTAADDFDWSGAGPYRVWVVDREGVPAAPIPCTRGASDRHLVLAVAPAQLDLGEDGGDPSWLVLGRPGHEPSLALVLGVGASDDELRANISVVLNAPEVYADPGPAPADPYPVAGDTEELVIADFAVIADGQTLRGSWTPPAAAVASVMEYRKVGATSWTPLPLVLDGDASVMVMQSGAYEGRVYALGVAGKLGPLSDPDGATVAPLPLVVTISPPNVPPTFGYLESIVTQTLSASISGGEPPYSVGLVLLTGAPGLTVVMPGAAETAVLAAGMERGELRTGSARFEVTDSLGATAFSATRSLYLQRYAYAGPQPPNEEP